MHLFWNKSPHVFTHHWNTCRQPDFNSPIYRGSKTYSLKIHQGGNDFGIWPINYIGYSVSVGWCPCIPSSSCSVLKQARSRQPLARTQLGTGQHLDCHDIQLKFDTFIALSPGLLNKYIIALTSTGLLVCWWRKLKRETSDINKHG